MELKENYKCSIDDFIITNTLKKIQNSNSTLKSGHQITVKNTIKNYIRWELKMYHIKQSTTISTLCHMAIYFLTRQPEIKKIYIISKRLI